MSKERALAHLAKWGREKDAVFTERPTFTVAQELGVIEARIAKTLAVYNAVGDAAHLVVTAGNGSLSTASPTSPFSTCSRFRTSTCSLSLRFRGFRDGVTL